MIDKQIKSKILSFYEKKQDKMLVSMIIEKVNKFETGNHLIYTTFLNMYEKEIAISVLNKLNISYYIYSPLEDTSKFVIFFFPEYMLDQNIDYVISDYIEVIKIIPKTKGKLTHKDYMGTIYSLGLKDEMIGDIFVCNGMCYFFCFKKNSKYICDNLVKVARSEIELKCIDIYSDEVMKIKVKLKDMDITVSSLRVDLILSDIFTLSRNEVKQKIQNGDLYVNSREMFFPAYIVKENDIVSFKRCGKIKIAKVLRHTKSGKIVVNVKKYI